MTFHLQTDKKPFRFHIIYIGMNTLKPTSYSRTKQDIETIRHLYADLDYDGPRALTAIENSELIPKPNFVLQTSPDK
ncbi:MAG TPA: hypothetical protein VFA89_03795, partial [Terriglobales bacterium]|nr:hypothetical protein [Terriglobales bacterium]